MTTNCLMCFKSTNNAALQRKSMLSFSMNTGGLCGDSVVLLNLLLGKLESRDRKCRK